MTVPELLGKINTIIINPIIRLVFVVATIVFFWGIVEFINSETSDSKREKGKKKLVYGILGMLIMFGAYGIIRVILNSFGISGPARTYLGI